MSHSRSPRTAHRRPLRWLLGLTVPVFVVVALVLPVSAGTTDTTATTGSTPTTAAAPTSATTADQASAVAAGFTPAAAFDLNDMLNQVNAVRASVGVAPLRLCTTLVKAAQGHSDYQAAILTMTHYESTPGMYAPADRAVAAGYGSVYVGENVAAGYQSVAAVMAGWINSPGHYANLVDPRYTDVGFGLTYGAHPQYGQYPYWTQDFGWAGSCGVPPIGVFESATSSQPGRVRIVGWTIDPMTANPIAVHVYVDGVFNAVLTANVSRPDVAAFYPAYGPYHGFDAVLGMNGGAHQICTYAIGSAGNTALGCQNVVVMSPDPFGALESATGASPGRIRVTGWSIDPDTSAPIAVDVYVDGTPAGTVQPSQLARADLAMAFPSAGPNHGYQLTVVATGGPHTVCTYGVNAAGTFGVNRQLGCSSVDVASPDPTGVLDTATGIWGGRIRVTGWAIDPEITAPISVQVYVDGVANGSTQLAGVTRPDVGTSQAWAGPAHGYDLTVASTSGSHTVCVSGVNAGLVGSNRQLGCATLTVPGPDPLGALDQVTSPAAGRAVLVGWGLDPELASPIAVYATVDGGRVATASANLVRADVGAVHPSLGSAHGFSIPLAVASGTHAFCVWAVNSGSGANVNLGCRSVTVG